MRPAVIVVSLLLAASAASAQWEIATPPPTTADLRGIDNVGKGVAWASGSDGTVLRTEDDGYLWQRCAIPPGAEHLDFRGIQAFDANTAIVMSSGKGSLSRLYKTTDGCQTWKLLFTNPDTEGFWDVVIFVDQNRGYLLGDPVQGSFQLYFTSDSGTNWRLQENPAFHAKSTMQGVFAASNSSLWTTAPQPGDRAFGSGGIGGSYFYVRTAGIICLDATEAQDASSACRDKWSRVAVPIGTSTASSGIFSLAFQCTGETVDQNIGITKPNGLNEDSGVAVGGDYLKPEDPNGTAALTTDRGKTWLAAITPPHGFRSAVAYDASTKTWITVGPNGTDISPDDGRNWRALRPGKDEPPDADQHWNALSLPFVVGPHGRIGRLRSDALKP